MDFQQLLEGGSNEERLAGILLAQKFLETDGSLSSQERSNILHHLISTVSPLFILRMLCTKTSLNVSSVHDIAVNLLEMACQYPNVIELFQHLTQEIYSVAGVSGDGHILDFLAKVCKLGGQSYCEAIFRHALSVVSSTNPQNMLNIFDFLVEMTLHCEAIRLTTEESKALRSLIMEGWGAGGSQEDLRDTFIIATIVFLSRIHPSWTVEEVTVDEKKKSGRFAMVLCSIVCGEFRLLEHECVHMLDEIVRGLGPDNSQHLKTGSEGQPPQYDEEYISTRLERVLRMSFVCYEIFDVILSLLVGEDTLESVWSELPGDAMEVLQREMSQSIHLFYEFIAYTAKLHKENAMEEPTSRARTAKLHLTQYLNRGMQSFSQWILEDEDLHQPMVAVVEQLFPAQTDVPQLPSSCHSLSELPAEMCKSILDIVLRGQYALINPGSTKAIEAYFRIGSFAAFEPSRSSKAKPAHMRVELVESSHADILITSLAAMTQISEVGEDPDSLSSLAKKMRYECIYANSALCSVVCAAFVQVGAINSTAAVSSHGLINGRTIHEWQAALVVASTAIELMCAVFQTRATSVGKGQGGESATDTMTANYMGLSLWEVQMLVTAAQGSTDESFHPKCKELTDSSDFGYWIDCNAQLLETVDGLFSPAIFL